MIRVRTRAGVVTGRNTDSGGREKCKFSFSDEARLSARGAYTAGSFLVRPCSCSGRQPWEGVISELEGELDG